MSPQMTAAALNGPASLAVTRRPVPEPGAGEVRVRVEACGVCGTDLHFYRHGPLSPGTSPGHEAIGRVDAVGDGVDAFAPGDRVAVEPLASCGACDSCRAGRPAICTRLEVVGVARHGGFAEYVAVGAGQLFRLPEGLAAPVAALTEPMAVSVHGLRQGRLAAGQRVLVLGAGTIGLTAARAALSLGAGEVWISARHPHQAALARELGAVRVLSEAEAAPAAIGGIAGEAAVDLVVETVGGDADTLAAAAAAVRPGGTIAVLGLFFGNVSVPALPVFLKENALIWSNCYARGPGRPDFEIAIELVDRHRDALAGLTTHQVPLAEIDRAFELAADKRSGAVKVTVLP